MSSNYKEGSRINRQVDFLVEADKLKSILRRTKPIGLERRENSAEHSWQVVLTALTLAEYANTEINLLKVVKMLALHDLVEIDTDDVFHYDKENTVNLHEQELAAATRIFGILPEDLAAEFKEIWQEFEARESPEALFANAADRLMAFLMNRGNKGGTWVEYDLSVKQVIEKNCHAAEGSKEIWEVIQGIIEEATANGFLKE